MSLITFKDSSPHKHKFRKESIQIKIKKQKIKMSNNLNNKNTSRNKNHLLPIIKMHHCGNDYVYVDFLDETVCKIYFAHFLPSNNAEQQQQLLLSSPLLSFKQLFESATFLKWVTKVSHRRFGVGADGVICLVPPTASLSSFYDVRMKMFNADASCSSMCGNGLISLAALTALKRKDTENNTNNQNQHKISLRIATGPGDDVEDEKKYSISLAQVDTATNRVEIKIIDRPLLEPKLIPIVVAAVQHKNINKSLITTNIFPQQQQQQCSSVNNIEEEERPRRFWIEIYDDKNPSLFEKLLKVLNLSETTNQETSDQKSYKITANSVSTSKSSTSDDSNGGVCVRFIKLCVVCIGMGNPHALIVYNENENENEKVTSSSSIDQFPLEEIAHEVMKAKVEQQQSLSSSSSSSSLIFPEGVNVTIGALRNVRLVDLDQEKGDADEKSPKIENNSSINNNINSNSNTKTMTMKFTIHQRTFERGSGETLACGSGSCALVVAAAELLGDEIINNNNNSDNNNNNNTNFITLSVDAQVFPRGGETRVQLSKEKGVVLSGIPKIVFRGEVDDVQL